MFDYALSLNTQTFSYDDYLILKQNRINKLYNKIIDVKRMYFNKDTLFLLAKHS